jgi:hypothetical protein
VRNRKPHARIISKKHARPRNRFAVSRLLRSSGAPPGGQVNRPALPGDVSIYRIYNPPPSPHADWAAGTVESRPVLSCPPPARSALSPGAAARSPCPPLLPPPSASASIWVRKSDTSSAPFRQCSASLLRRPWFLPGFSTESPVFAAPIRPVSSAAPTVRGRSLVEPQTRQPEPTSSLARRSTPVAHPRCVSAAADRYQ